MARGQTSSRTPFILSEVMTDVARGKVPLRLASLCALCEFKQPRSGPVFISLKLPPSPKRTGSAEDNGICDGRVEARQGVPRGGGGAGISSEISESARPGDGDTTAAARGARPDAPPDRWNARRLAHFVTAARRGRGRGGRGAPPAGAARRRDPVRVERDPVRHFFPARGAVDVDIGSSTSDAGARIAGRSCDSPPTARRGRARRAVASALNRPPSASRPVKRDRAASGNRPCRPWHGPSNGSRPSLLKNHHLDGPNRELAALAERARVHAGEVEARYRDFDEVGTGTLTR